MEADNLSEARGDSKYAIGDVTNVNDGEIVS
jgi:hypothetical protein